jgi:hypothetical protein
MRLKWYSINVHRVLGRYLLLLIREPSLYTRGCLLQRCNGIEAGVSYSETVPRSNAGFKRTFPDISGLCFLLSM